MNKMTEFENHIKNEYHDLWSDPKNIHRDDKKIFMGWHFGYYEKGWRTYKKAVINMNNYVGRLLDINNNNYKVLDAGCGVGATLIHLAKKYTNSIFFGITLSSNEINLAENLKRKNNIKNINFYQQSYNNTDFPDEYFDCIYALETVCYAEDKDIV
jgi:cyclopropane fatty-acyl-phospholipid synthase-like methyltransferase